MTVTIHNNNNNHDKIDGHDGTNSINHKIEREGMDGCWHHVFGIEGTIQEIPIHR